MKKSSIFESYSFNNFLELHNKINFCLGDIKENIFSDIDLLGNKSDMDFSGFP